MQEARPRPRREHRVRAGSKQERLLQLVQRPVHRSGRGERTEIAPRILARAAMFADLRKGVVGGDLDVGEALVVAQKHVVARLELLDQVLLQQQRLGLALRGQEHHRAGGGDHSPYACVMPGGLGIGGNALPQAARLADIEHVAAGIEHAVDAGPVVELLEIVADHQVAGPCRTGRGSLLFETATGCRGSHVAIAHAPIFPRAARNRNRIQDQTYPRDLWISRCTTSKHAAIPLQIRNLSRFE